MTSLIIRSQMALVRAEEVCHHADLARENSRLRTKIAALEEELAQLKKVFVPVQRYRDVVLPHTALAILNALYAAYPHLLPAERLISMVWGDKAFDLDSAGNNLSVQMSRVRRSIAPRKIVCSYGEGYGLDSAAHAWLRHQRTR